MKKRISKVISTILVMGVTLAGLTVIQPSVSLAKAKLSKTKLSMKVGDSRYIYVKGYYKKVKWSSTNKYVATVKNGTIKAKHPGSSKIKAKAGKKSLSCKVTVKPKKNSGNKLNNDNTSVYTNVVPIANSSTVQTQQTPSSNKTVAPQETSQNSQSTDKPGNVSTSKPGEETPIGTPAPNEKDSHDPGKISNSELADNIKVSVLPLPITENVLLMVRNNNNVVVDKYSISYELVSSSGEVIDSGTQIDNGIAPGTVEYIYIIMPSSDYDDKIKSIDVSKSTVSVTASVEDEGIYKTPFYDAKDHLDIELKPSEEYPETLDLTVKNKSEYEILGSGVVLFLDASDKILAARLFMPVDDLGPHGTYTKTIMIPDDHNASGERVYDEDGYSVPLKYAKTRVEFNGNAYVPDEFDFDNDDDWQFD